MVFCGIMECVISASRGWVTEQLADVRISCIDTQSLPISFECAQAKQRPSIVVQGRRCRDGTMPGQHEIMLLHQRVNFTSPQSVRKGSNGFQDTMESSKREGAHPVLALLFSVFAGPLCLGHVSQFPVFMFRRRY